MRLYEIPEMFREWERRLLDAEGEVDADLDADLDRLGAALTVKVDAIAALIREQERTAEAYRAEARAFTDKARARERTAEGLKAYVLRHLRQIGLDRVSGLRFDVTVAKNAAPSISWGGWNEIPEGFREVVVKLDGRAAHEAHKLGQLPEGFVVHHGEHLRIR